MTVRKILRIVKEIIDWFARLEFVIRTILLLVLGVGSLGGVIGWHIYDPQVTVDFNPIQVCARGSLSWLQDESYLPSQLVLADGAPDMRICDDEELTARKSEFLTTLVAKYPGCILYEEPSNTLELWFNPKAMCKDTTTERNTLYLCDGAKASARTPQQVEERGAGHSRDDLTACKLQFFEEQSRPRR